MTYLDIIFIAILIVTSATGAVKGFIKTLFGFASTIVALIFAYLFYGLLSNLLIESTKLYGFFQEKIAGALDLKSLSQSVVSNIDRKDMIQGIQVPDFLKNLLIQNDNSEIYHVLGIHTNNSASDYVSSFLATIAINVLAFVILFILGLIIIGIVASLLDVVAKLPVLKQLNHLSGFVIGLATGIIMLWVVSLGLYLFVSMQGTSNLQSVIEESSFVLIFYNNNWLMNFLGDITKSILK